MTNFVDPQQKPAFLTIYIDAAIMKYNDMKFAVVIDDNEIKCYGVSKENWKTIKKDDDLYVKAGSCKPLVYLDDRFIDTAKQMNWVIVGEI